MRNGRVFRAVLLAAALVLLTSAPRTARAANVVADDQIVQGNLCVGTPCAGAEAFSSGGEILLKGNFPHIRLVDTDSARVWEIVADSFTEVVIFDLTALTAPFVVAPSAPNDAVRIAADGKVGVGTCCPSLRRWRSMQGTPRPS